MSGAVRHVRLGRLFERRKILGFVEEPMLSVFREHGVVLKDAMVNHNQTAEDRSIYQLVEPGWLAVNRMKAWQGALGISQRRGIMSGHYICFAPRHGEDPSYLHYALRSPLMTAHFRSISRGVRPGQIEIDNDQLAATPIPLPPVDEQRRIADFLDDRVARIDQIITARRHQSGLMDEHVRSLCDDLLTTVRAPWVRLGPFIRGIEQGWSPQCEAVQAQPGDWGVLKVGAVQPGWFDPLQNKRLPDNEQPKLEYEVRAGDLLVSRANTPERVGFFAVVPAEVRPQLILCDKIMRIEVDSRFDPLFIALVGQSRRTRDEFTLAGTGTSGSMVNIRGDDVRNMVLPLLSASSQSDLVAAWQRQTDALREAKARLSSSIDLLQEYKISLITAAVTGGLDVTTAGSGLPG